MPFHLRNSLILGVACLLLILATYYLQYSRGLIPCPLCLVQRMILIGVTSLLFLQALVLYLNKKRLYGFILVCSNLLSWAGIGFAARQVWLQYFDTNKIVASCGADLYYRLRIFPFHEVWQWLIQGQGNCQHIDFTWLGISLAGWALLFFTILSVILFTQIVIFMRQQKR